MPIPVQRVHSVARQVDFSINLPQLYLSVEVVDSVRILGLQGVPLVGARLECLEEEED